MKVFSSLVTVFALALPGHAGSLSGTVRAGSSGSSIVYLEPVDAPHPAATAGQQYIMSQKNMKFTPQVLVVPVGATVVFKNEDSPAHNVYWPSVGGDKKQAHNLGTFLAGQQRTYKFDQPGIVPLLCNVHPEMEGYVIVTSTPYYAQAMDILGLYQIDHVPDGQYKVTVWHAGKKPTSRVVSLSGSTKLDFDLSR
jgi:plastocyanin